MQRHSAHADTVELALAFEAMRQEVEALRKENEELRQQSVKDAATIAEQSEKIENLQKTLQSTRELLRLAEKGIFRQGRERLPAPDQILLAFMGTTPAATPAAPAAPPKPKKERPKPTGRKALPENLPVIEVEELPEEVKAAGLDAFTRIGQDSSESVEKRAASLVVVRVIRPKFVRKGTAAEVAPESPTVLQAPAVELPIERGLPGPGLLADTIVNRWLAHLPLNRLEKLFSREGWDLSRATMCNWHLLAAELVTPLVDAMWADARKATLLCTDATGVLVLNRKKCRRAHFFVVAAPGKHILFGFSRSHSKAAIDALLGDFKGALVADAATIYDHLYARGDIIEHGCWAHVRRYFYFSSDSDSTRSKHAMDEIGKLFDIERNLNKSKIKGAARTEIRQAQSRPIVDKFFQWCVEERGRVLSDSPIDRALKYALNQKDALSAFLTNPDAPIHNNLSERELRRLAVGRKNWLFVGSDEGGVANAAFTSLLASCQHHGIEPLGYLRDLFCLLPSWNLQKLLELSPLHWKTTIAREDVRAKLEANVYRRASLGQLQPKAA